MGSGESAPITAKILRRESIARARAHLVAVGKALRDAETTGTSEQFIERAAARSAVTRALRDDAPTLIHDLLEEVNCLDEQLVTAIRERDEARASVSRYEKAYATLRDKLTRLLDAVHGKVMP